MRYSYEYKRKCVELYREGRWPETPTGIKDPDNFHDMIRRWVRAEEANGPDVLKHRGTIYRFLRRQVKWSGIPKSLSFPQFFMIHTAKDFSL